MKEEYTKKCRNLYNYLKNIETLILSYRKNIEQIGINSFNDIPTYDVVDKIMECLYKIEDLSKTANQIIEVFDELGSDKKQKLIFFLDYDIKAYTEEYRVPKRTAYRQLAILSKKIIENFKKINKNYELIIGV